MKLTANELLTALDEIDIFEALRRKYYDQWRSGDRSDDWITIRNKLDVLDDLKGELRSMANAEGVDRGRKRT